MKTMHTSAKRLRCRPPAKPMLVIRWLHHGLSYQLCSFERKKGNVLPQRKGKTRVIQKACMLIKAVPQGKRHR